MKLCEKCSRTCSFVDIFKVLQDRLISAGEKCDKCGKEGKYL